jgi:hypothetical protein
LEAIESSLAATEVENLVPKGDSNCVPPNILYLLAVRLEAIASGVQPSTTLILRMIIKTVKRYAAVQ